MEERNLEMDDDGKIKLRKSSSVLPEEKAEEEGEIVIDVPDFEQFKSEDNRVGLSEEELAAKAAARERQSLDKKEQAEALLDQMKDSMMRAPVAMTVSCIGTPTCQMGVNMSQALCEAIVKAVREARVEDILPRCFISGCPNSCARHQVAGIGFTGRKVKVNTEMVDAFDCFIGGRVGADVTRMGERTGTILATRVPEMLVGLGGLLKEKGMSFEQAMDDAAELLWIPLSEIRPEDFGLDSIRNGIKRLLQGV